VGVHRAHGLLVRRAFRNRFARHKEVNYPLLVVVLGRRPWRRSRVAWPCPSELALARNP
jgi:hypothetical protein